MRNPRCSEEFTIERIKQVAERGLSVREVTERLGVFAYGPADGFKRYMSNCSRR